jgi:hypothetical protein
MMPPRLLGPFERELAKKAKKMARRGTQNAQTARLSKASFVSCPVLVALAPHKVAGL